MSSARPDLVPGCRVRIVHRGDPPADEVMIRDLRSKERHFVPHGTEALVIGVERADGKGWFGTVMLFVADLGFFRTTSPWLDLVWSPVNNDGNEG